MYLIVLSKLNVSMSIFISQWFLFSLNGGHVIRLGEVMIVGYVEVQPKHVWQFYEADEQNDRDEFLEPCSTTLFDWHDCMNLYLHFYGNFMADTHIFKVYTFWLGIEFDCQRRVGESVLEFKPSLPFSEKSDGCAK